MLERWACPNAVPDGGGKFRCGIVDLAHQEGLSVLDLERVTAPIELHLEGIGEGTRCGYPDSRFHSKCFGFLVSQRGRNSWIDFAKKGERQVVLRGNEHNAAIIFGEQSIKPIREALANPPVDFTFVISCK